MKKKNKVEPSLASCLCLCLSTSLKPKFQPNSSENYFNLINLLREVPQTGGGQQNSFLFFSWEFFDEWLFPAKYSEHTWLCKGVRPQDLPPRSYCVKRVAESPSDEDWYFGLLKVCWFEILCSDGKSVTFTCFHVSYSIQLHFLSGGNILQLHLNNWTLYQEYSLTYYIQPCPWDWRCNIFIYYYIYL